MHIPFSPKAAERARQNVTAHQSRRRERFVEATRQAHDQHFGQRREFGKRTVTASGQTRPRRIFEVFKSK